MIELTLVQKIAIWILPVLFAITVHEVAHGWVASKLGDKTALIMGRLTLNPFKHIDLIGTIIVPALLLMAGGIVFGWAKPVPVNFSNLRHPRRDAALVAAAGPVASLLMAFVWAFIAKFGVFLLRRHISYGLPILLMGHAGITINLILLVLNLIPIPPLDGSRIVSSLLPRKAAAYYERIAPFGFFILLFLLIVGVLGAIIKPLVLLLMKLVVFVAGL